MLKRRKINGAGPVYVRLMDRSLGVGESGMCWDADHWAAAVAAHGRASAIVVPGGGALREALDARGVHSGCAAGFSAQPPWQVHDAGVGVPPAVAEAADAGMAAAEVPAADSMAAEWPARSRPAGMS